MADHARVLVVCLAATLCLVIPRSSAEAQGSSGVAAVESSVYASGLHAGPAGLSFAADGSLFVGTDIGPASVKIARIPPGGGSSSEYGLTPIFDPDGVVVDRTGDITGYPGAVVAGSGDNRLYAVLPDETVVVLHDVSPLSINPNNLETDGSERVIVNGGSQLITFEGGISSVLFSDPSRKLWKSVVST